MAKQVFEYFIPRVLGSMALNCDFTLGPSRRVFLKPQCSGTPKDSNVAGQELVEALGLDVNTFAWTDTSIYLPSGFAALNVSLGIQRFKDVILPS